MTVTIGHKRPGPDSGRTTAPSSPSAFSSSSTTHSPPPPSKRPAPSVPSSSSSPSLPHPTAQPLIHGRLAVISTSNTTSPVKHDRVDAENENELGLLESVPDRHANHHRLMTPPLMTPPPSVMSWHPDLNRAVKASPHAAQGKKETQRQVPRHTKSSSNPPLTALPAELIDNILSHVSAHDLAALSATSQGLREHAVSDYHWHRCVQENVPSQSVTKSGPCATYRELYAAHDLVWFLPKYKIWFCDRDLMGKLIVVRFDQRRGCIEGYQLLAVSNRTTFEHWPADQQVIIHGFEPQVKLHLDKPVLQFRVRERRESSCSANRFADEMPMAVEDRVGSMFSNFLLTRPLGPEGARERLAKGYPYDNVWPPPAIPAHHHVSGARSGQALVGMSPEPDDRPWSRKQVSDQTFRVRQWIEMAGTPPPPGLISPAGGLAGMVQVLTGLAAEAAGGHAGATGVHIGEELITYSTLDPVLYTPTATKPWRGIWVGDYSGHGCEFLLINQPDDAPATDAELGLVRGEQETEAAWRQRRLEGRIYRGRLEAIKLTGDPNVPRGEYTFVADDLGPGGFAGIATDAPFVGARVVRSKGHVAATGFVDDKYIDSQLLLISPNRLAQYWVGFGHISFFERVQIDDFVVP